ncbi:MULTISPECIES: hypothetical protein [unclassified Janthinobacterium]|uniref:hypothetical protein n=1 Tax=unclassified Janthinobacterium TaxID=2610881 RepID=UPI0027125E7B|nr:MULTISPECIES: hypothetical protein [unclassified Janthinobacterium]MDO8066241.1 hypothetical protein [Janthinobacterium sp. SUN206]MDO8072466.1 hypothetical protein [Janthinobacterium sp. SUN176]
MQDPIIELNQILHLYDAVNMRVMDSRDFEKYLGKIYSNVRLFQAPQNHSRTTAKATEIINVTSQLLERVVIHHQAKSRSATLDAVKVYDGIVSALEQILMIDLNMREQDYDAARKESQALNALLACGILPPGHHEGRFSSRFEDEEETEARRVKALEYAQDNIEEFARFVFHVANNDVYVRDKFLNLNSYDSLALFERVKSLRAGIIMVEGLPSLADAPC